MKNIIKNVNKFNDIKLATGLDLKTFKSVKVIDISQGVSIMSGVVFLLPNGKAFFKHYPEKNLIKNTNVRIINEILSYYLAKDLDIECAKYEPATFEDKHGLVSYDVINENIGEKLITGDKLIQNTLHTYKSHSYKLYEKVLNICKEQNINVDVEKTLLGIYKIMVYDILTMQCDRHKYNINFIVNKNDNSLRLSPIFDNEFMFNSLFYNETVDETEFYEIYYGYSSNIFYNHDNNSKMAYEDYLRQVASLAVNDDNYKQVLLSFIKNINLSKAYKSVEKLGYEVNSDYKKFTFNILSGTKKKLYIAYKKARREKNKLEKCVQKRLQEIENIK